VEGKMVKLIISERKIEETLILDLSGDITFSEGNVVLRKAVRRLIGEGQKKIILNMENVVYVDSSGIGEMVSAFVAISREGGSFKLINLPTRIYELLMICKLLTVFDVSENTRNARFREPHFCFHYLNG
jgi:anti-sigma B factor antagonist